MSVSKPWLTFQQRYITEVEIFVRKRVRSGASVPDLHVIVKVFDQEGYLLAGQYYSHYEPPPDSAIVGNTDFSGHITAHIFSRPGKYTIAVMAYDTRTQKGNFKRFPFVVSFPPGEPLPEIARNLPLIEFPSHRQKYPTAVPLPRTDPLRIWNMNQRYRDDRVASRLEPEFVPNLSTSESSIDWTAGQGKLSLPISGFRPIQLDVVVNLSLTDAWNGGSSRAPNSIYRINADELFQVGKVLSQISLNDGCVRLSAADILRQDVFADREPGLDVDWRKLIRSVESAPLDQVDVRVLLEQKTTTTLFAKFLERLATVPVSCVQPSKNVQHILIVVSDAFLFPTKTEMTAVRPDMFPDTRCYFLQLNPVSGPHWDQIGRVLAPLHPRRWEFSNAIQFHKVLGELVADIESASRESKVPPAKP